MYLAVHLFNEKDLGRFWLVEMSFSCRSVLRGASL
jgi:hypothetical protein